MPGDGPLCLLFAPLSRPWRAVLEGVGLLVAARLGGPPGFRPSGQRRPQRALGGVLGRDPGGPVVPLASTAAALQQSAPGNTRSLSTRWPTLGKSGPRGPGLEGEDPARASKGTWHPRAALRLSQPRTGAGARSLAAKDQTLAQKWLRRFVDLISDAPAPAVREATGMEDPLQYLQGLMAGPGRQPRGCGPAGGQSTRDGCHCVPAIPGRSAPGTWWSTSGPRSARTR